MARSHSLNKAAPGIPEDHTADSWVRAFRGVDPELSYTPEYLTGEPFVLYRARVTAAEIHVRGRDFADGTGSDQRVPVQL